MDEAQQVRKKTKQNCLFMCDCIIFVGIYFDCDFFLRCYIEKLLVSKMVVDSIFKNWEKQ